MKTGSVVEVKYTKEIVLFKVRIAIKRNDSETVQFSPALVICSDGFRRQRYMRRLP